LPLHGGEVIKDPMILTLSPRSSGGEGRFRETDRTSKLWLGLITYRPSQYVAPYWAKSLTPPALNDATR
jgi:hypothetical protein